jgi:hypothetical protein
MRSLLFSALAGLAVGQSNSTNNLASSLSASSTTLSSASATSSTANSAITVAADGSGQYTAINAAINAAQNGGIPTVTILPGKMAFRSRVNLLLKSVGTYTEAVTVVGTATVTLVGATATAAADWSQNQVTIANTAAALTIGSNSIKGATFRHLNFVNTASTGPYSNTAVLALRGSNIGFYGCSVVSPGGTTVTTSYGLTIFANSYIEGADKIFYNVPSIYVYKSTIVPLVSGASIVYSKGATVGNAFYNSTVVFDSSSVQQKSGYTNTGVFLGAPNAAGATVIYRNVAMGSLISPQGVHPSAGTVSSFYGEFATTGPGSYSKNVASRSSYDNLLTADQVSQYTIDKILANAFPTYGSSSTTWVDSSVLSSIADADAAQLAASSSTSAISSTGSLVPSTTANATLSASVSATPTASACVPSATLTVSQSAGACEYGNVSAAIAAIPNDSKPYTILIGPGIYNEQISITRNGKITLRGATNSTRDYTQNQVTIQTSNGVLTSAGQNEQTPVIFGKKANDNSGLAVYNINFANVYPQTKNTAALAADFYGANIAAYGCSFTGFQDTLLANKGTQVFSNCYIEGCV